jgi:hypothetical protein
MRGLFQVLLRAHCTAPLLSVRVNTELFKDVD